MNPLIIQKIKQYLTSPRPINRTRDDSITIPQNTLNFFNMLDAEIKIYDKIKKLKLI